MSLSTIGNYLPEIVHRFVSILGWKWCKIGNDSYFCVADRETAASFWEGLWRGRTQLTKDQPFYFRPVRPPAWAWNGTIAQSALPNFPLLWVFSNSLSTIHLRCSQLGCLILVHRFIICDFLAFFIYFGANNLFRLSLYQQYLFIAFAHFRKKIIYVRTRKNKKLTFSTESLLSDKKMFRRQPKQSLV